MKILIILVLTSLSTFLHAQGEKEKLDNLSPEIKKYIDELYAKEKREEAVKKEELENNKESSNQPLEMHGYFRSGTNFFTTGGSRNSGSCLALDFPRNDGLFYRFGNECRDYAEFSFSQWYKKNGIEFRPYFMIDLAGDSRNPTETEPWSRRTRQLFVEIKGIFDNDAALWVGRRYYRNIGDIGDLHVLDGFHVQSSGNGAGVSDIPFAGGKYNVAVIGYGRENQDDDVNEQSYLMDVRASYNIGLNNYQFALQNLVVTTAKGTKSRPDGRTITLQWQREFGFLNNRVVGQYAQGSMSENPGCFGTDGQCFNPTAQEGSDAYRVFSSGVFDLTSKFKMHYLVLHQESEDFNRWSSAGVRPHYMLSKYWSIVSDVGFMRLERVDNDSFQTMQNLDKYTIALQASTDASDFWDRPSIRFYYSYFNWNKAAASQSGLNAPGREEQRDASVIGAQTEIWF
jgi:maltoporin